MPSWCFGCVNANNLEKGSDVDGKVLCVPNLERVSCFHHLLKCDDTRGKCIPDTDYRVRCLSK